MYIRLDCITCHMQTAVFGHNTCCGSWQRKKARLIWFCDRYKRSGSSGRWRVTCTWCRTATAKWMFRRRRRLDCFGSATTYSWKRDISQSAPTLHSRTPVTILLDSVSRRPAAVCRLWQPTTTVLTWSSVSLVRSACCRTSSSCQPMKSTSLRTTTVTTHSNLRSSACHLYADIPCTCISQSAYFRLVSHYSSHHDHITGQNCRTHSMHNHWASTTDY